MGPEEGEDAELEEGEDACYRAGQLQELFQLVEDDLQLGQPQQPDDLDEADDPQQLEQLGPFRQRLLRLVEFVILLLGLMQELPDYLRIG